MMQGASKCESESIDMTSDTSSSVPDPPGKAMNASPSSIIFAFRSAMVSVTMRRVMVSSCTAWSMKN